MAEIMQKIEQLMGKLKDSDCIDCEYEKFCEEKTIGKTLPCDFILLYLKLADIYENEEKNSEITEAAIKWRKEFSSTAELELTKVIDKYIME